MSKDRDSGDSASGVGMRLRNQSPSSQRQSRERERTNVERRKNRGDIDQTALLISNEMTPDHSEYLDDSRLSGNLF